YLGDYDYYLEKIEEEKEFIKLSKEKTDKPKIDNRRRSFQEEKQLQSENRRKERKIAQLEVAIEEKELDIARLEEEMTKPEVFQDHEKALELTKKVDGMNQELEKLMEEWANLQDG